MKLRKVLAAGVLAVFGTVAMTASKASLLFLWASKPSAPPNQWYATLCLVMLVPEVLSIARTLWGATLLVSGSFIQWPPFRLVLLDIFIAVLESAALSFFTTEVAAALPVYIVLPLMNVVLLLQALLDQWRPSTTPPRALEASRASLGWRVSSVVLCFLGLAGFVVLAAMLVVRRVLDAAQSVSLVASLLALSVVWCRPVRRHVLSPDKSSVAQRHNVGLLVGVVRAAGLVGFCILTSTLGVASREVSQAPLFLWRGLLELHESETLVYPLIAHCLSNLAACAHTRLGAYYTATRSSLVLPTVLSTLAASVLFLLTCTGSLPLEIGLPVCVLRNQEIAVLVASAVLWLVPLVTLGKNYFPPSDILFRPEIESFLTISYTGVCFDQNLFLNYNPFSVSFGECLRVGEKRTRVFLCTTMYREADYEMEQLLKSLSRVSKSRKLKAAGVYLESHIFLDNGASELTLNEFALQLMSLVERCFSLARAESVIHKTPSGIQILCCLPGGMPLFLHLKDSSLVKAKKRWSQVMYMKYILEYRVKTTSEERYIATPAPKGVEEAGLDAAQGGDGAEGKNSELLLQIRSLLEGWKVEEKSAEDGNRDSARNSLAEEQCESEQSSDQGIDVADDISDTSSQKDAPKTPEDVAQSGASASCLSQDGSYDSLLSGPFVRGKINPAYVPDDDEEAPPKWLPEFVSKFLGASPMHEAAGEASSADLSTTPQDAVDMPPDPMFTLSDRLSDSPSCQASNEVSENVEAPPAVCSEQTSEGFDKQTYILATDADMLFSDTAVLDLVNACNEDLRLGAACGRTYPMGKKINPIVWYQIFEYAKDFWMIKSAQNVIGSVMCCPGCFSLYRAEAINDVVSKYSEPTTRAGDVFTKDTGEDRWMCTLMMMRGWKLRYSTYAVNSTYCPDSISEFIKQRRRWILSDFANSFLVFRNLPRLMRSNGCFSFMYALYLVQLFVIVIFSPGTTVVMLTVGVELLTGAPYHVTTPVMAMIFVLYGLTCCLLTPEVQVRVTKFSIIVLGLCMAAVVIGAGAYVLIDMIKSIQLGGLSLMEHYLLLALTGSLVYAALIHPKECYILVYGLVYLFYFPAMYMLLPLYALCNIVDQSWGTRDNQKPKVPKLVCFPRIRRKKQKKARDPGSCENLADDPDAVSRQVKQLTAEEESFWRRLVDEVIGKSVNLGLSMDDLAKGLRGLRFRVVVAVMILNLLWVVGLSFFYLWSFKSSSQISAYGILNGVLYAFSFFIQIVGMTVYRLQDGVHRLGKKIYGTEKPYYVRSPDER